MVARRVYDDEKHIHFVTFSCYKRRKYLKTELASRSSSANSEVGSLITMGYAWALSSCPITFTR